jgi:cytidylate kinase
VARGEIREGKSPSLDSQVDSAQRDAAKDGQMVVVAHLSIRDARNTKGTRGTPE